MNVTFRQLRVFLTLAECRSITTTARQCHITQPTVSMQMRELSEAVGMPLYEQIGKRLHLTAAGEALAETARAMTDEWARFGQTVDAMRGLRRGRLRVAVVSTAEYFVPNILGDFCQRYPEVDIALEVLNRDGVVQRLRDNADDLYIMSMPPQDMELERHSFLGNPLVMIAPAGHALAKRRQLQLEDLAGENFILRERGSGTRLACDAHFNRHRFRPRLRLELGSNEAIKHAVAGGLGVSVVSRHALTSHLKEEGLAVLRVADFPIDSHWWVLYPHGKRLSPIAAEFLKHLDSVKPVLRRAAQT